MDISESLKPETNIFSGMFSLLRPTASTQQNQQSLVLPDIFTSNLNEVDIAQSGTRRQRMENTACPHKDRKHYAKNMCCNCYHSKGRKKLAWLCRHTDRKLYARGRCQYCYIRHYYSSVVTQRERSREKESSESKTQLSDQ